MLTNGCYATVWAKEKEGENWMQVRLSQSMKDKEGKYYTDYSGFPTLVGKAKTFMQAHQDNIPEKGLRVRVITCGSRRRKSEKDGKYYQTDIITDMELANAGEAAATAAPAPVETAAPAPVEAPAEANDGFMEIEDTEIPDFDDDLPFC